MTRVIAQQWVSLDGYAAGPDGGEAGLFARVDPAADEQSQRHNLDLVPRMDHVLLGRRTYESFVGFWPTATATVADAVNQAPKVVASRTLAAAPWPGRPDGTVVVDAVDHLRRHRASDGADVLVWGSLALVRGLADAGELDELDLVVVPEVVGAGTPLLHRPTSMELLALERWGSLTHVRYAVHHADASARARAGRRH